MKSFCAAATVCVLLVGCASLRLYAISHPDPWSAAGGDADKEVARVLESVRRSCEQSKYDEAIGRLTRAIEETPRVASLYAGRAVCWAAKDKHGRALEDMDAAIRLRPQDARLFGLRGTVHAQNGDLDAAIRDFDQAIGLAPDRSLFHFFRGRARYEQGRLERALPDLSKAIELEPDWVWPYVCRASAEVDLRRYQAGLADAAKALELDPKSVSALVSRAGAYVGLGNFKAAVVDCNRALSLDPKSAMAYTNRGAARVGFTQNATAIADFTKALELDPNQVLARVNRAECYMTTKQYELAVSDLTWLIERRPDDRFSYASRAKAYWEMGDKDKAFQDSFMSLKLEGEQAQALLKQAQEFRDAGRQDEAARVLRQTAKEFQGTPFECQATTELAEIEYKARGPEAAIAILQTLVKEFESQYQAGPNEVRKLRSYVPALRLYSLSLYEVGKGDAALKWGLMAWVVKPDDMANANNMAWILAVERGEYDKARKMIEPFLGQTPVPPALLDTAGWIAFLDGRHEDAIGYLLASTKERDDADTHYHLGRVYEVLDRLDEARIQYKKALELGLQGRDREDATARLAQLAEPQSP